MDEQHTYHIAFRKVRRRRRMRVLFLAFLLGCAGLAFAASAVFEMDAWSKLDVRKIIDVPQTLLIYDRDDAELTALYGTENRIYVSIDEISFPTRHAFISAEDARFYEHIGIDPVRILGAAWADLKAGSYVQGASTISQQLIKLSHLTGEKRMKRKLEEAVLAYQLESIATKDQILEMYLNYVYFGGGYYGIEAAARGYFGVHAKDLTVAQSAQLAGILKSPTRYAPHLNETASLERRNLVLDLMLEYGFLSESACLAAKAEPVVLLHGEAGQKRDSYTDYAMQEAAGILGVEMDDLLTGGYRIKTFQNADLQANCSALFSDARNFPVSASGETPEAAIVLVDVASGGIAALLGGRETGVAFAYNRATRIRRQPGSVIKPVLVYAPALEAGFTAATMLLDEQMDFDGYRPSNASDTFAGWVTMREAVTRSLNVPAVSVMSQVGVGKCKAFASQFGIAFDSRDKSLALALGGFTYGVSPLQVAGAYAAFARGGSFIAPQTVREITDSRGNVLYRYEAVGRRIMEETNAYVLTSMLESVVKTGTGRELGALQIPLAGKTGTTGDAAGNRDIWMAAYNPAYAATVWMGFDDGGEGRVLPEDATGGTYPAMLLKKLYAGLYEGKAAPDFQMPSGVREYRIDTRTLDTEHMAVLANALTPEGAFYSEVFVLGTEPEEMSSYWQIPKAPENISATAGDGTALIFFDAPSRFMIYRLYRENSEGKSVLLGEFSGENGSVAFEDLSIQASGTYQYYVIPVHPQLTIQDQPVTGESSKHVYVKVYF